MGTPLHVTPTGESASAMIVAAAGGTVTLTTAEHTYTLDVTPNALTVDAEITLEEVTVDEIPGALAVRFSPDGLVFRIPARLSVDAPYDVPMLALAFRAGEPGVEMEFAAPHEGGLARAIAHFSEAAFAPPADAALALDEEQRAEAALADRARSQAFGLGAILRGRVELLVEDADVRVAEFGLASRALHDEIAEVDRGGLADLDASSFGPPTVGELLDQLIARLFAAANRLYVLLTPPTCAVTGDVTSLLGFVSAVTDLRASMMELDVMLPDAPFCVTPRLTVVSSPSTLTAATDEVILSRVALEIVGPGTAPAIDTIHDALFTFVPTGATGPTSLATATGVVSDVHFLRPAGAARTPNVTIVVRGSTMDSMLGALPSPAPVTVSLGEPATFSGTIHVSSSCGTTTTTTVVCGGVSTDALVEDLGRYDLGASLRVTVAGDLVSVEATGVTASRRTEHLVDEEHQPTVLQTLGALTSAVGSREADGRVRVRLCGTTDITTIRSELCVSGTTSSTVTEERCWDVFFAPSPSAAPTALEPQPTAIGCGAESPSSTGSLALE